MGADNKPTSPPSQKDPLGPGPHPIPLGFFFFTTRATCFWMVLKIFSQGSTSDYIEKIAMVANLDLGWLYLGLFLINLTTIILFLINQGFRFQSGVPRPDQQLFRVVLDWKKPSDKSIGFAVLEDDGLGGAFNRSSRACLNLGEYLPLIVGFVILAGFVFPYPVFVLCIFQLVSRVVMSLGYSSAVGLRLPGFALSSGSMQVMEMMVLFIGLKALHFI